MDRVTNGVPNTSTLITTTFWTDLSQDFYWISIGDPRYRILRGELIERVFPSLRSADKTLLANGLALLINFIHYKSSFGTEAKSSNLLWDQLTQNDMVDLRALLNLLLPFIDDTGTETKKKQLQSLSDLYLKQDQNGNYIYTNSQYNRCIRRKDENETVIFKRPYLPEYFEQNLELLLMSIESIANKLYVNWLDVLPLSMDRYKESSLYDETVTKVLGSIQTDSAGRVLAVRTEPIINIPLINGYIDPRRGIPFQDIYNVVSNHLFREINNIKWLIYDVILSGRATPYIVYLESIINLDNIWGDKLWSQITDEQRDVFTNRWTSFMASADPIDNTILGKFYFFFAKYHRNSQQLIRSGELILTYDTATIDDDAEEGAAVTPEATQDARMGLLRVPAEEIYTFFYDQIMAFKKSWFYYVIKIKGETSLGQSYLPGTDTELFVTPKNVYNYCKLMVSYVARTGPTTTRLVNLPQYWQSLAQPYIEMFLVRLFDISIPTNNPLLFNDWSEPNWFNINNNLLRIYPGIPRDQLVVANYYIHLFIHARLVDIIFESMIYHGLLVDFHPNRAITSAVVVGSDSSDFAKRKKVMLAQYFSGDNLASYRDHSYYFVTGRPYGELGEADGRTYFDYLTKTRQNWTFTYAMNWVSQINFFHRYVHTRVMYVTGSTGVGKSTQVPKLLMYAQVMVNYNLNSKIICTQPRVAPTVGNARIIASQMGIPIQEESDRYKRAIFTNNYYIQYKHQQESFVARNSSFLRIVTDGTLLEEIKTSPFLSGVRPDPNALDSAGRPATWVQTFRSGNRYDVVIVDEAHEHNGNMDMILTLVRDSVYVNNSLKLVIVSATMEDDEPIYRRYYRKINDNRAYPLSSFIASNGFDRANIDRRIHISAPGATTQYVIEDHWLTIAESAEVTDKNYVEKGIERTIQVANSTTEKDILLFLAGQADIKDAVEKINAATPPNIIAMGFYSALDEQTKDMIMNIHITLKTYTRHKEDVFLPEADIQRRVQPGTYNRVIIAATNVAEASITLENLRYVIDTGYAKSVIYDAVEGVNKTLTLPISWSSAVQRRGRVGRVASGVVYHLYAKEKIINNKTAYDIADSNFTRFLVPLIKSEPADTSIIASVNDINQITNLQRFEELKKTRNYGSDELIYDVLKNPRAYLDIIRRQYLIFPDQGDIDNYFTYYGHTDGIDYTIETIRANIDTYMRRNHDDYDYQKDERFFSRAFTGYDDFILDDNSLEFYIIHPDENVIVRNKYTGKMKAIQCNPAVTDAYYHYMLLANKVPFTDDSLAKCQFEKIDFNNFFLPKYFLAADDAKQQMLLIDVPRQSVDVDIHFSDITKPGIANSIRGYYDKQRLVRDLSTRDTITVRSKQFDNFEQIRMLSSADALRDMSSLLWYTYTMPYYLEDDVLALILMTTQVPIFKEWSVSTKPGDIKRFIGLHSDPLGDIHFLYRIWQQIKSAIGQTTVPIIDQLRTQFSIYRNQYFQGLKIPYEQFAVLDRMYQAGQLGSRHEFYYYVTQSNIAVVDPSQLATSPYQIDIIARNNMLNPEKLKGFYTNYISTVYNQHRSIWVYEYQLKHGLVEEFTITSRQNIVEWARYKLLLPNYIDSPHYQPTNWDRIYEAYVRAYSMNLMKVEGSYYLRINKGVRLDPDYWGPKIKREASILSNRTEFLIYHTEQSTSDETTPLYLTPTKISWVFRLNPIYYYYVLFSPRYQIDDIGPDVDPDARRTHDIIEAYANAYDFSALFAYLEQLDDPSLRRRIRSDITKKIE